MKTLIKGPVLVLGPEDGESYWQPKPHSGYMTVKVGPHNHPSNLFSMGTQLIPAGCHVRSHGHARNDEVLFFYEGKGYCMVEGEKCPVEAGSTVVLGRYVEHSIHNDGDSDMKFFWVFSPPGLEQVVEGSGKRRTPGEAPPETFERPQNLAQVLDKAGWATPEELRTSIRK